MDLFLSSFGPTVSPLLLPSWFSALIVTGRGANLRARNLDQLTLWPPSTLRIWPVINEAASDAMKTIASACSSEMPRRAMGTCFQPSKEELQDGRVVRFFITDGEVDCRNLTGKR